MKRLLYIFAILGALGLTYGGGAAMVDQVIAADGLKSSVITFVLASGFALLGPAFLAAAIFVHHKTDSRARVP